MKRTTLALIFAAMLPLLASAQDAPAVDATAIANTLLDRLDAGDYAAAEASFGADMAKAVPQDKLQAVWESLPAHIGATAARGTASMDGKDGVQLVHIPLHAEAVALQATTAVDADGRIVGFLIQPAPAPAAPAVAADAGYTERDVSIGEGDDALPATLAMPKPVASASTALVPAVVLVHGSGPQDRDETIGPNRPFLDIARGLAAQGIAVLRYDKRTKARPQDYMGRDFTIDDETTDDAVAAVETLRAMPGIDPARVFVFGHSQGAMLAPRIASHSGHVAGLVLLAAPARPLLDILVEQRKRMSVLDDGRTSPEEAASIDALRQQVAAVRGGDASLDPSQLPLGQSSAYWRSTDAVDPVAEAKAAHAPMLILQGTRDIQVVDADWQRWKAGLHDDPEVLFKLYDGLNHLGIAVTGDDDLAAYSVPGHVDAQLIDNVAGWIKDH